MKSLVGELTLVELYDTYSAAIYGACLSLTKDPSLAQEALLNTFLSPNVPYDAHNNKSRLFTQLYQRSRRECLQLMKGAESEVSFSSLHPFQRVINELINQRGYSLDATSRLLRRSNAEIATIAESLHL